MSKYPMDDLPRDHIDTLIEVMRALRDPETGCPWDQQQTFATIAPYTIEEAYEVADAIANDDTAQLCDELGDLLLQVIYHSKIADELGHFKFSDVIAAINDKMIRRHPHVFGTKQARKSPPKKGFWEDAKAQERKNSPKEGNLSVLSDISATLPAMTRATKLQARAARVNFDWPDTKAVLDKVDEELAELREAEKSGSRQELSEEFGDLLFVLINFARHHKLDPETALRSTNKKFTNRFNYIEQQLETKNKTIDQCDLNELDALWNDAKAKGIK